MVTLCSRKDERHDLSKLLTWRGERMDLSIPDGVLPAFLIEAYNRVSGGEQVQIDAVWTPERAERLRRLEEEQYPGIELIWLILGMIHQHCQRRRQALDWYRKIVAKAAHPLVYHEMATLSQALYQYTQALQYRR